MINSPPQKDSKIPLKTTYQVNWPQWCAVGLSVLTAGIALFVSFNWMTTPTRPEKVARTQLTRLVEVSPVTYSDTSPLLQLHGEVMAATSVTLYPQVEGRINSILGDLAPGMVIDEGQLLATIDETPYSLAVQKAQAVLADAKAKYQQEQGDQKVATGELKLLQQQLKTEITPQQRQLILREPQLAQAQAAIDSARTALEEAKLNLSYTRIYAPFSGIISSRSIDVGSYVGSGNEMISLVITEAFWIKVTLPTDYVQHLKFSNESPGAGSTVKVYVGKDNSKARYGEVYRRLPELEPATRQAQILLRVDDPFAIKDENKGKPSLFVNDYVALDIVGNKLKNVVVLEESLVHNGNQVWLEQEGELHIQTLQVIWREQGRVIASSGLQEGDKVVTTNIANAYDGLAISTTLNTFPPGPRRNDESGTRLPGQDQLAVDRLFDRPPTANRDLKSHRPDAADLNIKLRPETGAKL